jgi:hypothetical protein
LPGFSTLTPYDKKVELVNKTTAQKIILEELTKRNDNIELKNHSFDLHLRNYH